MRTNGSSPANYKRNLIIARALINGETGPALGKRFGIHTHYTYMLCGKIVRKSLRDEIKQDWDNWPSGVTAYRSAKHKTKILAAIDEYEKKLAKNGRI